jgi:hypothetical protein
MTSTFNRVNQNQTMDQQAHSAHAGNQQNPEDYLEKQQVGTHLKDAISHLLENRPENPIQFLADHFKNMHSSSNANQIPAQPNGIVASGHNIMKAYRLLMLNRQGVLHNDQKSFSDNVF